MGGSRVRMGQDSSGFLLVKEDWHMIQHYPAAQYSDAVPKQIVIVDVEEY